MLFKRINSIRTNTTCRQAIPVTYNSITKAKFF